MDEIKYLNKLNKPILYLGWYIENIQSDLFKAYRCFDKDKTIIFRCNYKKAEIISLIKNNKTYTAWRYTNKYIGLITNIKQELLYLGCLWDYEKNQPGLKSYINDMLPYYKKCKRMNIPTYIPEKIVNLLEKKINEKID